MGKDKILYIYHTSSIGGGSFCLYNIIDNLDKNNFEAHVILKSYGPLADMLQKIGAKVYFEPTIAIVPYNTSLLNISVLKTIPNIIFSLFKIRRLLNDIKPKIVHINSMMLYHYLYVTHNYNIKSIIHIRENWPKNEHKYQLKIARNTIIKYADKIIAINNTSYSLINFNQKTSIIYDWIDFTNRDEDVNFDLIFGDNFNPSIIYTHTGGLDKIKGALQIVNCFISNIKDKDARLLMVGVDSNFNYRGFRGKAAKYLKILKYDTYQNKVRKLIHTDNRIICIKPNYNIKRIIEKSDVILSYFTIPHANLILAESIYLGKVVVAALTPEALEYSNEGRSAVLFKMNDYNDFVENVLYVNKHYDNIKINLSEGAEIIRNKFSPDVNIELLNNIYKNLIN